MCYSLDDYFNEDLYFIAYVFNNLADSVILYLYSDVINENKLATLIQWSIMDILGTADLTR